MKLDVLTDGTFPESCSEERWASLEHAVPSSYHIYLFTIKRHIRTAGKFGPVPDFRTLRHGRLGVGVVRLIPDFNLKDLSFRKEMSLENYRRLFGVDPGLPNFQAARYLWPTFLVPILCLFMPDKFPTERCAIGFQRY